MILTRRPVPPRAEFVVASGSPTTPSWRRLVLKGFFLLWLLCVLTGDVILKSLDRGRLGFLRKMVVVVAGGLSWTWALVAGIGGFVLLVHQGPLPITNGWFAMFSGIAACPLTARLVNRYARVAVPLYVQFGVAVLIFVAGRVAVVVVLHRPFLPQ